MAEVDDTEDTTPEEPAPLRDKPSYLPFVLLLTALLVYFGFQTLQLASERSNLSAVKSNQEGSIQEAQKIQAQFNTLVSKTSELADQGHAGAKMVMEELLNRGVSAAPQAPAPDSKTPATTLPKASAK